MKYLSLIVLSLCSGCVFDQNQRQVNDGPSVVVVPNNFTKADLIDALNDNNNKVSKDITTSSDAIQANVNSMFGASIGKLGDKVVGLETSLDTKITGIDSHIGNIQSDFNAKITGLDSHIGNVESNFNSKITGIDNLSAKITGFESKIGELNTKIAGFETSIGNLNTKIAGFETKIGELNASAQAGFDNEINKMSEDFKAGHDVNIQFNKEMLAALVSANKTTTDSNWYNMIIFISIVIGIVIVFIVLNLHHNKQYQTLTLETSKMMKSLHEDK